jgi:hypothetical protein
MRATRSGRVVSLACAIAAAALFGCAAREKGSAGKGARADDVVCTYEPVTGSHIAEARCLTRAQMEERSAASRASMERLIINANRPKPRQPAADPRQSP